MASVNDHLRQWDHNRKFFQTIPTEFSDWIVAGVFYTALHAVEALLTADGAKARSSHIGRHEILVKQVRYQKIFENFKPLYDAAYVTRYSANPTLWVSPANVQKEIVAELLYPIEKSVRKLLSERKPSIEMPAFSEVILGGEAPKP